VFLTFGKRDGEVVRVNKVYLAGFGEISFADGVGIGTCRRADKDNTISAVHHVKIIGVMGMATNTNNTEIVRNQFRLLRTIRDQLQAKLPAIAELSMGMSNDYKIALEEGATMLRIGRALFTKEDYSA
jgi:uncharacterized pyridoxal phosphate-containing UPF0001 family protein